MENKANYNQRAGEKTKQNNEESQIHSQENQAKSLKKDELLYLSPALQ